MSKKVSLSKILLKLYEENSRYEINPPIKVMKELELNALVIADMEISEEDIPILCKFFNHKEVLKRVERIQLYKSCGGKVNRRRTTSALSSSNFRLFKELIHLIEKCKRLQSVSFESVDIPVEVLPYLGKALTSSSSDIRWLGFHACNIGGDKGMQILTPYLGRLRLQVLGIEQCELTDQSIPFITSILKAQENFLDSLYWNSTLRVDPSDDHGEQLERETDHVYACGLIALSLSGNKLTGRGILALTRVLRKNYWLLGLNLADNLMDAESVSILIKSLQSNAILQALLLKGNPGVDSATSVLALLRQIIARNTNSLHVSATPLPLTSGGDDDEDGDVSKCNGHRRLGLLPERVTVVLQLWQRLQTMETNPLFRDTTSSFRLSKLKSGDDLENSLLTMSTLQSRKRYQKPTNETLAKRKDVSGIAAAYSIFYFLDQESEQPPVSYVYKQNGSAPSPKAGLITTVGGTSNTTGNHLQLRSPVRNGMHTSARYSEVNGFEDVHPFDEEELVDPLRFAIPTTHSPPHSQSPLARGGNTTAADFQRQLEQDEAEVERMSWDHARLWPSVAATIPAEQDLRVERSPLAERPPSRMSIRPSTERIVTGYDVPPINQSRPVSGRRNRRPVTAAIENVEILPRYMQSRTDGRLQNLSSSSRDIPRRSVSASTTRGRQNVGSRSGGALDRQHDVLLSPTRGRSAVFGKATRDTRMRTHSSDQRHHTQARPVEPRRYYSDHGEARHQTTARSSSQRRRSASTQRSVRSTHHISAQDVEYMSALDQHVQDLTMSMQNATRNLEAASAKLQHASASLNESMLNMSSSQMNSFLLNNSANSASGYHHNSDFKGVASGIATYFHQHGTDKDGVVRSAQKTSRPGPVLPQSTIDKLSRGGLLESGTHMNGHSASARNEDLNDRDLRDSDLIELVREKLYNRLEGLLHEE